MTRQAEVSSPVFDLLCYLMSVEFFDSSLPGVSLGLVSLSSNQACKIVDSDPVLVFSTKRQRFESKKP
jgi:hypothetical protein